jgi:putative membrane protein
MNRGICNRLLLTAVMGSVIAAPGAAQESGSRQTRDFVQSASEADTFEIMEATAALAQSTNPQVIAFARQMIHDHGETRRRLRDAATQAKLKLPPLAVGASESPLLAALQSARGAAFDKLFWEQQALAHRSALIIEKGYATSGDVARIREVAVQNIPLIQAHMTMAEMRIAQTGPTAP